MSVIVMEQVSHRYGRGPVAAQALTDVDLVIEPGEFVALWGPSGSGKSTLCNLAGAIDLPTQGRVLLGGRDVREMNDTSLSAHRNRTVGFIFQQFNLIQVFSALENVMLPLLLRGMKRRPAERRAAALLEELHIAEFAAKRPDQLSGGQRQRVAVARALVHSPDIVIADEPTANLDSVNADRILDMMVERNRAGNTTFLFATHDPRLLDRVGRRLELVDGRMARDTGRGA